SKTALSLPDFMGSIAILFWGMSLFLVIGQIIYQFSIVSSIPLLTLLLIGIYFFGINRINDNHQIRLRPQVADPSPNSQITKEILMTNRHLPHLEVALGKWLLQRKDDIKPYVNTEKRYPIYVISSQGGGIYAAYHSAKALAVLSEQVLSFSDHIFAISGVSGGSVGATVFTNALRNQANGQEKLSDRIDHYFNDEHDRLAMILSAMLFGNAAQTLFPLPVAAWDRSLGLELGFENRNDANPSAIKLDDSFYITQDPILNVAYTEPSSSNPRAGRAAPYLVLNTTEVENGRRYIFSPFRLREGYNSEHLRHTDADFHEPWLQRPSQMKPMDIRFSTAAGLSARFPVVSPYGFFPGSRSRRLIDGGLYDNSGAITAREIIDSINTVIRLLGDAKNDQQIKLNYFADFTPQDYATIKDLAKYIKVYPIAIVDQKAVSLDSSYADAEVQEHRKRFKWLGWSAIDAVFSTREARLQKAVDLLDHDSPQKKRILLRKDFRLEGNPQPVFSIPLGWTLSCQARSFINDQIQPLPKGFNPRNLKVNQDGDHYSLLPCEQKPANANPSEIINNSGMKREQVRTRADQTPSKTGSESGDLSLSLPFWQLIWQLKDELTLPTLKSSSQNAGNTGSEQNPIPAQLQ
ncbi:MAG: patatin-like phospholipase family protein, partial [Cyanobium sp.]